MPRRLLVALLLLAPAAAGVPSAAAPPRSGPAFVDASDRLPDTGAGRSMDSKAVDVDRDGDLDVVLAKEFQANRLLLNDGRGRFADVSAARLPRNVHDHEDVAAADLDRDGDLDLVVASEDDRVSELWLNDGRGRYVDASSRLPVQGVSNSVVAGDVDRDGDADLVFGNAGPDYVFVNDGRAGFTHAATAIPPRADVTQDVELGDVDRDGDLDLVLGNVDANRLLLNDGRGVFAESEAGRLPLAARMEETREADLADVDRDGDLDLFFANVDMTPPEPAGDRQDRLLVNDGRGWFTDETARRLGVDDTSTLDGEFVDVDRDRDLDLVTAVLGQDPPIRLYVNDGRGVFADATERLLPYDEITGDGVDVEVADVNRDGRPDLYLSSFTGKDTLLLGRW